jgi:alkaline phosphatase
MKKITILILVFVAAFRVTAQENYKTKIDSLIYPGGDAYPVKTFKQDFKKKKPKNVIFMIGDGMGVTQVFAGITANHGHLFLDNFKYTGFSRTQSASDYVTDSGAGGTALSAGQRTYNKAIGVSTDSVPLPTILEESEAKGLATGLVSTSAITHATPASFIAHQVHRDSCEEIAADFLKTDIDVFIGGGYKHFTERKDGKNLTKELEAKGYTVLQKMSDIKKVNSGKLAGLTAPEHNGRIAERGNMLPDATETALNILSKSKTGFFIMVEGSHIDKGGHANNMTQVVEEMLDFDKAIGKALEFAEKNGETLIVVTADHETGGLSIPVGNMKTGRIRGAFGTKDHTSVIVPVFAYGPGAENFTGIMDNTEIQKKVKKLLLGE